MLRELLVEDAIAQAPAPLQKALTEAHAANPFDGVHAMLRAEATLKRDSMQNVRRVWVSLLSQCAAAPHAHVAPGEADAALQPILAGLSPHDLALCKAWKPPKEPPAKPTVVGAGGGEGEAAGESDKPMLDPEAPLPDVPDLNQDFTWSLLTLASFCGATTLVTMLLEYTKVVAGVQATSPLHAAAAGGHCSVIELLVKADAGLEVVDNQKRTPLYLACEVGAADAIRALLSAGSNPHARSVTGETPLTMCKATCASLVAELEAIAVPEDAAPVEPAVENAKTKEEEDRYCTINSLIQYDALIDGGIEDDEGDEEQEPLPEGQDESQEESQEQQDDDDEQHVEQLEDDDDDE